MNYVELEERLLDSINRTYSKLDDESTLDLYRLTRSIDWVNVCFNPERAMESIRKSIPDDLKAILNKMTSGAILRLPEFRSDTTSNIDLIDFIVYSITWRAGTKFGILEELDTVKFDENEIISLFSNSPDLLLLYILSNNSFIKLEDGE